MKKIFINNIVGKDNSKYMKLFNFQLMTQNVGVYVPIVIRTINNMTYPINDIYIKLKIGKTFSDCQVKIFTYDNINNAVTEAENFVIAQIGDECGFFVKRGISNFEFEIMQQSLYNPFIYNLPYSERNFGLPGVKNYTAEELTNIKNAEFCDGFFFKKYGTGLNYFEQGLECIIPPIVITNSRKSDKIPPNAFLAVIFNSVSKKFEVRYNNIWYDLNGNPL